MSKDIAGTKNRVLLIKTYERDIAKYKTAILEKEVKILELHEAIDRLNGDIEIDNQKIKELEKNVDQQNQLMKKETEATA